MSEIGLRGGKMTGSNNKRKQDDRRNQELGPPKGWSERRRRVERRLPEVIELPFSAWLAQFRGHLPASPEEVKA